MKLTYFQLEKQLAANLNRIYIISGEEWLLKQEAIAAIRKAGKQAGFIDHFRLLLETEDEQELHSLLYANSLLGDKRLLEISFRDKIPTKKMTALLSEYSERIDENSLLIIEMGKLDARTTKSAWLTSLEKVGVIVTIWPIGREQLPQWIRQRGKNFGLQLQTDAIDFITDYAEGNLIAAAQIIEKISLHQPKEAITVEMIKAFFNDESRFSIYDLGDGLIQKDKGRLIKILQHFAAERTEPVLVLWNLLRELRQLVSMSHQLQTGVSFAALCTQYKVFPRRQAQLKKFLASTDAQTCVQLLQRATEIDKFIKGSAQGNVWQMLELFALTI